MWDDLEPGETIKIYDKGITVKKGDDEKRNSLLVSYHVCPPLMVREFADSV